VTEPAQRRAPLSVAADLRLAVDGAELSVRASGGNRLFVDFPGLRTAVAAARSLAGERDRLDDADATLRTTELTVEVRVRGSTVAVLGRAADPGGLSRRLGLHPLELRIGGGLSALGRELTAALSGDR